MTASIAVLLANPARADLSAARVASVRARLGGGAVRWLAEGIAAEFALADLSVDLGLTEALRGEGFDLAVVPAANRRKRLFVADMDSTMIGEECIDELAAMAGVGDYVADITARAMNGALDFEAALLERVGLLKGMAQTVIAEVLASRIHAAPGAATLVATLRAHGVYCALVSGGFTDFTGPVAAALGFDEHRANRLLAQDGRLSGDVARPILGKEAKLAALEEIAAAKGLAPADAVAVGDGANDLPMLLAAGMGVALHAKPAVAAQAQIRLHHADLTGLLYLQGYRADEFACLKPPMGGFTGLHAAKAGLA